MKSNSSSVFGFAALLVFLTFPVLAQAPAGVPSLDEMAGDWLPMNSVANPPDVNNFHDMLMINRDLTSFFCNPDDWLWGSRTDCGIRCCHVGPRDLKIHERLIIGFVFRGHDPHCLSFHSGF